LGGAKMSPDHGPALPKQLTSDQARDLIQGRTSVIDIQKQIQL